MIKRQQFFFNMTAKDYRAMINGQAYKEMMGGPRQPVQKQSKYHAQKTEVDGIKFDSKKESRDWKNLCTMEASGLISNLRRQVSFELQPKYVTKDGRKIRPISYVADFVYERDGVTYAQDSKGMKTDVYKIKRKMFEYKYPDIVFIES